MNGEADNVAKVAVTMPSVAAAVRTASMDGLAVRGAFDPVPDDRGPAFCRGLAGTNGRVARLDRRRAVELRIVGPIEQTWKGPRGPSNCCEPVAIIRGRQPRAS
jgi:hypothetical protein